MRPSGRTAVVAVMCTDRNWPKVRGMATVRIGTYTLSGLSEEQANVVRKRVELRIKSGSADYVRLGPRQGTGVGHQMVWVTPATPFSLTYDDLPSWDNRTSGDVTRLPVTVGAAGTYTNTGPRGPGKACLGDGRQAKLRASSALQGSGLVLTPLLMPSKREIRTT